MKKQIITIFGASGLTGKVLVDCAISKGLIVRAVVRSKSYEQFSKGIQAVVCDYNNLSDLRKTIKGSNGVIIVFGPRPPYKEIFCEQITKNIVKVMEELKIKRLICQTGAMIGDYSKNRSLFFELMSQMFRNNNPLGYKDRLLQEKVIKESVLDWTIIKPPRLTKDNNQYKIIVGIDIIIGLLSSISRESLTKFIIRELINPKFIRKSIFIKNY